MGCIWNTLEFFSKIIFYLLQDGCLTEFIVWVTDVRPVRGTIAKSNEPPSMVPDLQSTQNTYTPQCTSIRGLAVFIRLYLGHPKG